MLCLCFGLLAQSCKLGLASFCLPQWKITSRLYQNFCPVNESLVCQYLNLPGKDFFEKAEIQGTPYLGSVPQIWKGLMHYLIQFSSFYINSMLIYFIFIFTECWLRGLPVHKVFCWQWGHIGGKTELLLWNSGKRCCWKCSSGTLEWHDDMAQGKDLLFSFPAYSIRSHAKRHEE